MKILLQKIWKLSLEWDKLIPEHFQLAWKKWKHELQTVTEKGLPRCLYPHPGAVEDIQLHGSSDASMAAYGGVIYLRARYKDIHVAARTRIAPIKQQTVPRLELCGALLNCSIDVFSSS